jgi:hypothetical protein
MTWDRKHSKLEDLMSSVLRKSKSSLTLHEIVERISKVEPNIFTGASPKNSLYSILYRKEQKRTLANHETRFIKEKHRNLLVYKLNPNYRMQP